MRAVGAILAAALGAIPGLAMIGIGQIVTGGGEIMLEIGLLSSMIAFVGFVVGLVIGWHHPRWWSNKA